MHDYYGVNYPRLINPIKTASFFLFGARGTGKTTFLKSFFAENQRVLWINLLHPEQEDKYARNPESLIQQIRLEKDLWDWIVLDEVQKVPKLLDCVHLLVEEQKKLFALTGSSARKLKRGGANLLAGRALLNHLFPLTHLELGSDFNLDHALRWGTLPKVVTTAGEAEKTEYLKSYALSYLKEEVWAEHIVQKLDPFRKFLEIAAQCNGEPVNYSNIARDVHAETKTVQSYYQILEDTLVGHFLEAHHGSIRKRQRQAPKFYFFDPGITRALARTLSSSPVQGTNDFGRAFEQYVICESFRLNEYFRKDYSFSYLRTKDQVEIDLIISRPGMPLALVEIKSTDHTDERHTHRIEKISKSFKRQESFCLSRDATPKKIGTVSALPWQQGLSEIFGS